MKYSLTLAEKHDERLRALVFPSNGREGAALLLCGVAEVADDLWDGVSHRKLLSHEVVPIAAEDIVSSSSTHIRCKTHSIARALKRAAEDDLTVAFVHSHPAGIPDFSSEDDEQEPFLVELAQNRNGRTTDLISIVMTENSVHGRVWQSPNHSVPLEMVRVMGDRFRLTYPGRITGMTAEAFHRQALAFGNALNTDLGALRFGIVGAGATGSATGMFLARLGARQIASIDDDIVDESNLSRMHGATMADVHQKTPKVQILKRSIEGFGLGANVVAVQAHAGAASCRDILKSCDVIFGCTDDNDGRLLLNRLAYFYLIPVIDMGIGIDPTDDDPPRILEAAGRTTALHPGSRCLVCRRVVDLDRAEEEATARSNPALFAERQKRGYVRGESQTPLSSHLRPM